MQAVILCGGKGIRMGELTKENPKPLLYVGDKTILEHKLDNLPQEITEIILVIGYKKEKIIEKIGDTYKNLPVKYIEDRTISGTAHALWQVKDILKDRFIVMMGDDMYSKDAIRDCAQYDFSIVCKIAQREEAGSRIVIDAKGNLIDFVTPIIYRRSHVDGGLIFTGLYSLTTDIFNYEPVKLELKDEWGLPQTILKVANDREIKIVKTDFWLPVGSPEELARAENYLSKNA